MQAMITLTTNTRLNMMQDQGGVYDRSKLFWKGIEDVGLMAACAPPGGGRQHMSPRFTRHLHTLCMPPTSEVPMHCPVADAMLSVT